MSIDGYITTDLVLVSKTSAEDLIRSINGKTVAHIATQKIRGGYRHLFNTVRECNSAEKSIEVLLITLESLKDQNSEIFAECSIEFSVGVVSDALPVAEYRIPRSLVTRISQIGGDLSFVVYKENH